MFLLSSSCGNDSVAMLIKAWSAGIAPVVIYCHTGWAGEGWEKRIDLVKKYCNDRALEFVETRPERDFRTLMLEKSGFPMPGKTWCSFWLKAMPFLQYADHVDPKSKATVMIGKRRDESFARRNTPEFIESSEHHGGRRVWHPLAYVTESERNEILLSNYFEVLPRRSGECDPCVNANRGDMRSMAEADITKTIQLEGAVGQNMFRPHHHMGAEGFEQVIRWARSPRGKYEPLEVPSTCTEGYCE